MRRDDFKCRLCGASPAISPGVILVVDHVVPWSKGGETVFGNLQKLCEVCNGGKSDLSIDEGKG
jgi:5-methylcytosine-specific restriction endonuclease McrA